MRATEPLAGGALHATRLVEIALRARVNVQLLGLLNEGVEFDEGVRARGAGHVVLVFAHELALQLLQVVERQPLRIGAVCEAQVADAIDIDVVEVRVARDDAHPLG